MRNTKQIWQALIRRFGRQATPRAAEPERVAAPVRDDNAALQADVAGLKSGLEQLRQSEALQLEHLRRRVSQLESERDAARKEAGVLRSTLEDAVSQQEKLENHVNGLEVLLRELGEKHQAALHEALVRERRQTRGLYLAMTVAIMAFALGITGSIMSLRTAENNTHLLAGISQAIRDIQASINQHPTGRRHGPAATADPTIDQTRSPAAAAGQPRAGGNGAPPSTAAADEPAPASKLPEPDFVASGSLPLSGQTFSSRRDVRAFFQENARQPGVVNLPSGLQYKVLIPGHGKIPGPSDTVVIEYRAFRPDGTELDNSFSESHPSTLVVAKAKPGLEEALQQMREGAQWELYIPPALVNDGVRKRGKFGFEPLIYTVELLSVEIEQTSTREQ